MGSVPGYLRGGRDSSPRKQILLCRKVSLLNKLTLKNIPVLNQITSALRTVGDLTVFRKVSQWWHGWAKHTRLLILDWLSVSAVLLLLAVVYIPKSIWAEEERYRIESRRRMDVIQSAENFYHTLTGNFTADGPLMFALVSQTHDSLIGDSTFIGDQVVHVAGIPHRVDIPEGMIYQLDTTFTVGRTLRETVLDTTYTVLIWNDERADNDTVYISGKAALTRLETDPAYRGATESSFGSHSEVYTDYDWNRFPLNDELLLSSVNREPFIIEIDSTAEELRIASPITNTYVEARYFMFRFKPRDYGEIVNGEPRWRRR